MPFDFSDVTHLDCTLRDGGYYTNWSYNTELVEDYFSAIKRAGIKVVEIGYCSLSDKSFKGPYAFSSDDFLNSLEIPEQLKIAVMINASEFTSPQKQLSNKFHIDNKNFNMVPKMPLPRRPEQQATANIMPETLLKL